MSIVVSQVTIAEWGAQFFRHFTATYQREAVLAVLRARYTNVVVA